MKLLHIICGLLFTVAFVNSSPIVKREADDLSPLNEVYVFEAEDDQAEDGERGDRDKRKIGVKLGVANGVINFVFGKLDSFLDAKTKALTVLDDSNRAKNLAYGIDNTQSATGQFLSNLVSSKLKAATGSIGPVVNSATTFFSGAKSGLTSAFVSKFAPLSSLSGGLTGLSGGAGLSADADGNAGIGAGASISGGASVNAGINPTAILGSLLSSKISGLSSLSQSGGGAGAGGALAGSDASSNAGINLGAFANLGGGARVETTTEDVAEFNRNKVSLEVPAPIFGSAFTIVTNISKVLSSVILNSARRTQTVLEIFKPFFRGIFAIKGLPSDNPH